MTGAPSAGIGVSLRFRLAVQREISWMLSPISFALIWLALRIGLDYRIERLAAVRRAYREIRARSGAPLLVCANHLTLIDSFLITWALGGPPWFLRHFSAVPWNLPERRNFAATAWQRGLVYVLKCLPIQRGGRPGDAARVLECLAYLLRKGEAALIFPEGGRSRSGRIEFASAATGVGRVIRAVPDCRVLCVYLRGERQRTYSRIPQRGERFTVAVSELEPKSDHRGLRASRDLARQVMRRLAEMEAEYFDGRQ